MPCCSQLLSSCTDALMTLLRHCFSAPDEKREIISDGIQERQDIGDKLRDMKKQGKRGGR